MAGANESIPVDLTAIKNRTEGELGDASQPLDPNWGTGVSKGQVGAAKAANEGSRTASAGELQTRWIRTSS